MLGPVILTCVFAWNLAFTRQLSALPGKIRRDLVPTITTGWKFWVPASGINFALVPLQFQVRPPTCVLAVGRRAHTLGGQPVGAPHAQLAGTCESLPQARWHCAGVVDVVVRLPLDSLSQLFCQ